MEDDDLAADRPRRGPSNRTPALGIAGPPAGAPGADRDDVGTKGTGPVGFGQRTACARFRASFATPSAAWATSEPTREARTATSWPNFDAASA